MKKRMTILIILALCVLLLAGCGHSSQKSSVDLAGVPQVEGLDISGTEPVDSGAFSFTYGGAVYHCYIYPADAKNAALPAELAVDEIAAYSIMDKDLLYHAGFGGLPEKDWLVSFWENGSKGKVTSDNIYIIWKRDGVDAVPDWLSEFAEKTEK